MSRYIDADKLPITNTYALVDSKDVKPNEIPFAPLACVLKSDIDNAPTVEERPKGKWIESKEHFYTNESCKEWTNFYCSECDVPSISPSNFCPNCGARMSGGNV